MFIIFGTSSRITKNTKGYELRNACPNCSNNLQLKDYKSWFTLFFLPIFPINHIDTFYHCENCGSTYRESAHEALIKASKDKSAYDKEVRLLYSTTLVSCLVHLASVDGTYSVEEDREIIKVKNEFPEFANEIDEAAVKVKASAKPEELVFPLLRKSSQLLKTEVILSIFSICRKLIMADGTIDSTEENLIKDYLLVCGIPKSMYDQIMEMKESS